jgi:hypothetical protein
MQTELVQDVGNVPDGCAFGDHEFIGNLAIGIVERQNLARAETCDA